MRLFALLRTIVRAGGSPLGGFEPFEPKDVTNRLAEANAQTLRAGWKIRPFQIIGCRLGGCLAEKRQQSSRQQAKE